MANQLATFAAIGFVFIVFGASTISRSTRTGRERFRAGLGQFGIPDGRANLCVTYGLTAAEAVLTVVIVFSTFRPSFRGPALFAAGMFLVLFASLLAWADARAGDPLRCNCFGSSSGQLTTLHVLVDAVSGLVTLALALLGTSTVRMGPIPVLSLTCGILCGILFVASEWLVQVLGPRPGNSLSAVGPLR